MKTFQEDGVTFSYPASWQLDREETENGWTALVQSPQTAFVVVSYDPNLPTPAEMADTALEALREEYPDLESEPKVESMAGQAAVGHDIRFFSLDLTNTCWVRSFYADAGTVLVMCQCTDIELEQNEPLLRAIGASLRVED
jgi:hypothetical protein